MAEVKETTVQVYGNQARESGDAPAPEVQTNRGAPGDQAVRSPRRRIYIKVRYYEGAITTLTFYIPTKDGVVKERVEVSDQQWPREVINYLKTKGKHRTRTVWFYSSLAHMRAKAKNDEWVAKIPAKKLLNMIKSTKTWTRSGHAWYVVESLEQLLQGGGKT
jgi:hypothetical protein